MEFQLFLFSLLTLSVACGVPPNVIVIMTDDQGYGDLGCHGNPILKTPELDKLHAESVRFTDFHVSSFCTPTRAALLTGNYPARTGAFRTTGGRSSMHRDEKTMAELFAHNGYVTGMVGKWHLGDNAPHRPQDRGFQHVLWHRCGGIGQASDYFGNDYFDDHYERASAENKNGTYEPFSGYCTDIWFEEGMKFISDHQAEPFFLYLAPNAPHGPYRVPPEWAEPYKNQDEVANANFYGMIANIDHNLGLLRKHLDQLGIAENTILIFMTDNGTSAGAKFKGLESEPVLGYNAGMRGKKSSIYEGGIRVPFFIHWPAGKLTGGSDRETIAAHIDVLPTLAELCGIEVPATYAVDGLSLKPLLDGKADAWPRKIHIEQFHGGAYGREPLDKPFNHAVVMTERWRLVNSKKTHLYDITADPTQLNDVINDHPEVVEELKAAYATYWDSIYPEIMEPAAIDIGNPDENPTVLCSQDWFSPRTYPPYSISQISKFPKVNFPWIVEVKEPGRYRFTLRQFPKEAQKTLVATKARVRIGNVDQEIEVKPGNHSAIIELDILEAGRQRLQTYLIYDSGKESGAYFTTIERL